MDKIRKTIKAYALALLLFVVLTMILCTLISYTGFAEEWGYVSLITIITIVTIFLGYLETGIIETRGLIVGIISSGLFIAFILLMISLIFGGDTNNFKLHIILMVPLLAGGLGGVFGINRNKS